MSNDIYCQYKTNHAMQLMNLSITALIGVY